MKFKEITESVSYFPEQIKSLKNDNDFSLTGDIKKDQKIIYIFIEKIFKKYNIKLEGDSYDKNNDVYTIYIEHDIEINTDLNYDEIWNNQKNMKLTFNLINDDGFEFDEAIGTKKDFERIAENILENL